MQILTRPHLRSELLYDAVGTSSGQKVRMERGTTSKDDPHFQIAYLKKKNQEKCSSYTKISILALKIRC